MKIKHKLLNDFQYVDDEKKIITLKKGTILEDYLYKTKTERVFVDKEIVESNPDYFLFFDWKLDLLAHIKSNKIPQPSQIHKKILPFVEELMESISEESTTNTNVLYNEAVTEKLLDDLKEKEEKVISKSDQLQDLEEELKDKLRDIEYRERKLVDKEEEISLRAKRMEKREQDYKVDLLNLEQKEDDIRRKRSELTEKELDIEDKIQDLNRKERSLDQQILESSKNIDQKYLEIQNKIKKDLDTLSQKEKDLENKLKELNKERNKLLDDQASLNDKLKKISIKEEELKLYSDELSKLDKEISNWEKLHWKLKRIRKPPSAI